VRFPVSVGLVRGTQYVGQCLTSTNCQELMKSVGMFTLDGQHHDADEDC
jgi:hypothetical protein